MAQKHTYTDPDDVLLYLAQQGRHFGLRICTTEADERETRANLHKLATVLLPDHDKAQKDNFVELMVRDVAFVAPSNS